MEIPQNLTNHLTAANKNLDVLKAHFGHCFDKQGNFQIEKFQAELLAGEVNFSKESYGLDWLGRSYARLLASDAATTLLREDEAFNQKPENANSQNLLIKGDNLEILKHLSNAYFEQVKMIYIDPPYNTGGDGFVYQDDRKFTVKELQRLAGVSEEKAKRILEFTMSKSNSHSAWLTFMYPRLYVAKQLLRDDGVIFVSIDDNEVAQLRLLMDEVFGEENFVAEFIWKSRQIVDSRNSSMVSNDHESIFLYAKNNSQGKLLGKKIERSKYTNPDNDSRGPWMSNSILGLANASQRPNLHYTLVDPKTGNRFECPTDTGWRYSPETMDSKIREERIVFPSKTTGRPREKKFLSEATSEFTGFSTILSEERVGHTLNGSREVRDLLQEKYFDFPKPISLIKVLLEQGSESNDLVMDFFAGSGTTGDAAMQLNAEDGGKRKFILAQLPEKIDPNKSKAAYDFVKNELSIEEPTIFQITKERLIRAANKLREERPVEVAGKDMGFKVFETIPLWEDYHHKAETLEQDTPAPFRGDLLGVDDLQALFITWKTYDGSPLTEAAVDYDLGGYVGKYVNQRLYLMQKNFTTDHLVTLLEKVESDADFNPRSVIVFESNFQSKNLRELSESLKNFQNQKSLEIDFIMRF